MYVHNLNRLYNIIEKMMPLLPKIARNVIMTTPSIHNEIFQKILQKTNSRSKFGAFMTAGLVEVR